MTGILGSWPKVVGLNPTTATKVKVKGTDLKPMLFNWRSILGNRTACAS